MTACACSTVGALIWRAGVPTRGSLWQTFPRRILLRNPLGLRFILVADLHLCD